MQNLGLHVFNGCERIFRLMLGRVISMQVFVNFNFWPFFGWVGGVISQYFCIYLYFPSFITLTTRLWCIYFMGILCLLVFLSVSTCSWSQSPKGVGHYKTPRKNFPLLSDIVDPVQPRQSLSSPPQLEFRPPLKW